MTKIPSKKAKAKHLSWEPTKTSQGCPRPIWPKSEKPDAVSAPPARTEALGTGGRPCETHTPRAPNARASDDDSTQGWVPARLTDRRYLLLRVRNFPPILTFLSREDDRPPAGRTAVEERAERPWGRGRPSPGSCQGAATRAAPPRPGRVPGRGVLLTDPLGGGRSAAGRPRPAQTAAPLPPRPRTSALPPHSAGSRPLADTVPLNLISPRVQRLKRGRTQCPLAAPPTARRSHNHLPSPARSLQALTDCANPGETPPTAFGSK